MAGSDATDGGGAPTVAMPDLGSVGMGSAGVGVSDLEAATKFFVDLLRRLAPVIEVIE